MSTIYDVLEAPGYTYDTARIASKSTSTYGLGFSLLTTAQSQQRRPPPSSLVHEPNMVTELYRNTKQSLLLEVGQLEADLDLLASAQMRRANGEQQIHEHNDKNSAVQMDWSDFVEPAVAAAGQILPYRKVDAGLRLYARDAPPAIDTAIEVYTRDRARKRRIVIFEHQANYLASHALESLNLLASLASECADLDYAVVKSTFSNAAPRLEPISEVRPTDESIFQPGRLRPSHGEDCRKKAMSVLAKAACCMMRDDVHFGIISCHEQWVFLEVTAANKLSVSQVYSAQSTEPPLCGTLFALIIQAVGADPFPPRVGLTSTGAEQGADFQPSGSSTSISRTQAQGQGHSSGQWPAIPQLGR